MLRWYERLTAKIIGIGLVFFILLALSLAWQYKNLKAYFTASYKKEAAMIADSINTSIQTLMLNFDLGGDGTLVMRFIEEINKARGGAVVRLVHSDAVNAEYGVQEDELPENEREVAVLADGRPRSFEDAGYFNYIMPIKAIEGCERCHFLPDESGEPVPIGYTLGLAVVKIPTALMKEQLNTLLYESVKSMGVIGSLLLVLGFFSHRYIASPLNRMLRVIQEVTRGELGERVEDVNQRDEIGTLAANFNIMADQMERSFNRLENWNVDLAREVSRQTDEIRAMRDHYQSIIDSTQRVIYTTGRDLVIDSVNSEWDDIAEKYGLKLKREDLIGANLLDFFSGEEKERYRRICESILNRGDYELGDIYRTEFDIEVSGERKYFGLTISPLRGQGGALEGLVFVAYDISQRKIAEEMLRVEKKKLDAIMDGMGAAVNMIDENFRIIYMNRIMEDTFGAAALGRRCHEVIAGRREKCPGCQAMNAEGTTNTEVRSVNGRTYLSTISPIINLDNTRSAIEVHKDITYLKEMEGKLRKLTITDNLTGLYNKRYFMDKLADEMIRAQRQKTRLTLLFADIDGFKSYNDVYGHIEGDLCLASLGKIIRDSIRAHVDRGFRYGGEEFTMILPGADEELGVQIAERIRRSFAATKFTPSLDGEKVEVYKTLSVGVAVYDGEEEDPDGLIEKADYAMYRAKREGGDKVVAASAA
ncbi:MAG: diguanylate cyclase [Candidatus Nitrospinota bacterium M3_3B_026]